MHASINWKIHNINYNNILMEKKQENCQSLSLLYVNMVPACRMPEYRGVIPP